MDSSSPLSLISLSGTHREIGRRLGELSSPIFPAFLAQSSTWKELQKWKETSKVCQFVMEEFSQNILEYFPHLYDELVGLAEGMEMSYSDVLLWNIRGDVLHRTQDGCTTVGLRELVERSEEEGEEEEGCFYLAHNEDGDPFLYQHCKMVEIDYDSSSSSSSVSFVSFFYPGSLPGHSFAVNRCGTAQTINNLRIIPSSSCDTSKCVPRNILARAVLDARSLEDAVKILQDHSSGGGFHHTLCGYGEGVRVPVAGEKGTDDDEAVPRRDDCYHMISVEKVLDTCSIIGVNDRMIHANHTTHFPPEKNKGCNSVGSIEWTEVITASSHDRQLRGVEIIDSLYPFTPSSSAKIALLRILNDTDGCSASSSPSGGGRVEPIFRTSPTDTDEENNLATVLFTVHQGKGIEMEVFDMRRDKTSPIMKYAIP